jgi:HK97 gp10 family phage protein
MAVARVQLTGAKEIALALGKLETKLARKVGSKALRAGAKIVQAAAVQIAPRGETGNLKKSIKVRAGKSKKGYRSIIVGPGEKWFTGNEFYAAFVEFGHRTGKASSSIRRARKRHINTDAIDKRAEVPGQHYMEKAYEATKQSALAKVMDALAELTETKP